MGASDGGVTGALGNGLGNLLNDGVGEQERNVDDVVAEGRVGSDVNVLLLAVFNELVALQNGMTLNLVGSGHNTGGVNNSLEL